MEPSDNPTQNQESINQLKPVAKYLVMLLFIALPFIGGWVGYHYAPVKIIEVEKSSTATTAPSARTIDDTSYQISKTRPEPDLGPNTYPERWQWEFKKKTGQSYEISSTTIRIENPKDMKYGSDLSTTSLYKDYKNIDVPEEIKVTTQVPYLTILASTSKELVLTRYCFKAIECRYSNLYKFDIAKNTLREMNISNMYNDTEYGAIMSPDNRFVITTGYDLQVNTQSLYALDLFNDSYQLIDSLNPDELFCGGMGCVLNAEWLSDSEIEVEVYTQGMSRMVQYQIPFK